MKRTFNSAAIHTDRATEKAAVGLFRWMTTDHISKGRPIQFIPGTTILGSLGYILVELFLGILGAVLTGAIAYVMIASSSSSTHSSIPRGSCPMSQTIERYSTSNHSRNIFRVRLSGHADSS